MCVAALGIIHIIRQRYTRDQENQATDTSTTDNPHWRRRGWLVLLRARYQPAAVTPVRSRWRWAGCCSTQDGVDLPVGVVPLPRQENDIEDGQRSVAHDTADSEFRQLLIRVVDHEEDGVFRSIVAYL